MVELPSVDAAALLDAKRRQGLRVSVAIPARDEAATIGPIVAAIHATLVVGTPLVDELIVLDDGSIDDTARVARAAGARVVPVVSVLPEEGPGAGKGNALWASLYATTGDIICWVDADLRDFDPATITGLCEPLIMRPEIALVKAAYERPHGDRPGEGGRVTELTARPLFSQLFPHLSHIVQPLGGEYAGRRSALEHVPFVQGWGVEFALIVDIAETCGVDAITQVDLGTRLHRNRSLTELSPQATAIVAVALRRAGVGSPNAQAHDLVQFDDTFTPTRTPIEVRERPPMATVAAYRAKFGLDTDGDSGRGNVPKIIS